MFYQTSVEGAFKYVCEYVLYLHLSYLNSLIEHFDTGDNESWVSTKSSLLNICIFAEKPYQVHINVKICLERDL